MTDPLELDYLSRPLIDNVEYVITDTQVAIKSPNTIYAQASFPKQVQKKELLSLYRRVRQIAQDQKIRVSYKGRYRKTITERWKEYEIAFAESKAVFGEFVAQAGIVQNRGIHFGYRQDEELHKLYCLNNKFFTLTYRAGIIDVMGRISYNLTELDKALSRPPVHRIIITL